MACCIKNCSNYNTKCAKIGISYHTFPKDEDRASKWLVAIGSNLRTDVDVKKLGICSEHFNTNMIDGRRLRWQAVPCYFADSENVKPSENVRNVKNWKNYRILGTVMGLEVVGSRKYLRGVSPLKPIQETATTAMNVRQHDTIGDNMNTVDVHSIFEQSPKVIGIKKLLQTSSSSREGISPNTKYRRVYRKKEQLQGICRKNIKKVKSLQEQNRQAKRTVTSLKKIIEKLEERNLISAEDSEMLSEFSCPGVNELLKRKQSKNSTYPPALKAFAHTLHFLSPKAYDYVRDCFDLCLPHERSISRWFESIDGRPGFTNESFIALRNAVETTPYPIFANLVLDGMAIKIHVEYNHQRQQYQGYIDLGDGVCADTAIKAKEAMILMVVAINCSWKLPIGYFLIKSLSGAKKKIIVLEGIKKVLETGIRLVGFTFDGDQSQIACAKFLGAKLVWPRLDASFVANDQKVLVFYDAVHCIKLIRNTLGDMLIFIDRNGNKIKWAYIEELKQLQEEEGLHLGNKLKTAHILYKKQIMKVKLAVQLLSRSVADAIDICNQKLHLPQFIDSEATTKFIRIIDRCFDILNSHSIHASDWKKALCPVNIEKTTHFVHEAIDYIEGLTLTNGMKIVESRRKHGFIGFIIDLKKVLELYKTTVVQQKLLKYVPTYKLSQDHLELFNGQIKTRLGCNNNPTARQFESAYKKLLVRAELKDRGKGNCIPLERITILQRSKDFSSAKQINISTGKISLMSDSEEVGASILADLDDNFFDLESDPYMQYISSLKLSSFSQEVVKYVSGFVVFKIKKKLICEPCIEALEGTPDYNSITAKKNCAALVFASKSVIDICLYCEKMFRTITNFSDKSICRKLNNDVLRYISGKTHLFESIHDHMFDTTPDDNHFIHLIKAVIETYFKVRHFHHSKKCQDFVTIRSKNLKEVLLNGF